MIYAQRAYHIRFQLLLKLIFSNQMRDCLVTNHKFQMVGFFRIRLDWLNFFALAARVTAATVSTYSGIYLLSTNTNNARLMIRYTASLPLRLDFAPFSHLFQYVCT